MTYDRRPTTDRRRSGRRAPPPELRMDGWRGRGMQDRIVIEGMQFYGYHGVPDAEQAVGHRYEVDVELECDLRAAGRSDDVADTIDYGAVARRVMEIGQSRKYRLVERLAEVIAEELLGADPRIEAVRLRVRKLLPPIEAVVESAGVEIRRTRASSSDGALSP
jgi:dihydroneopterin aldolase